MPAPDQLKKLKEMTDRVLEETRRNRNEEDRKFIISQIGRDLTRILTPLLKQIADNARLNKDDLKDVLSQVKTELAKISVEVPEVYIPPIEIPPIKIPEIKVPEIKIPETKIVMPDKMTVEGKVGLNYTRDNAVPVTLFDLSGKPVDTFKEITNILGGGSGGFRTVQIGGINESAWGSVLTPDGRIKVESPSGATGLTDTELRASAVPVSQVSGARWSVEATATDLDIRDLDFAQDDVSIYQVSGHRWSTEATQSGTWNITSITNSVAATGDINSDEADTGTPPVKIGGIARTANPTAVGAGDRVSQTYDDLGRPVMRPIQVRDLVVTAYASLTNGTETTLLAASAGSFHDLIYVMASNNSDAAVTVDIRPVTAGNIVMSIQVPANGVAGVSTPVPYPQSASDTGNNWTADMPDITGTTVYLSALFTREV